MEIEGFKIFRLDRFGIHVNAPKASGGVAIAVKYHVFDSFVIAVGDKAFDGIITVNFKHKLTDFEFVIICYLSPENSVWGRNSEVFFSHLIAELYTISSVDLLYLW